MRRLKEVISGTVTGRVVSTAYFTRTILRENSNHSPVLLVVITADDDVIQDFADRNKILSLIGKRLIIVCRNTLKDGFGVNLVDLLQTPIVKDGIS